MKKQIKIGLASFGALVATTVPLAFATSCPTKKTVDVVWNGNEEEPFLLDNHVHLLTKQEKLTYKTEFNIQTKFDEGYELDPDNTNIYVDLGGGKKRGLVQYIVQRPLSDRVVLHIDGQHITNNVCVAQIRSKPTTPGK